jgi:hypothetical protein
MDTKTDEPQMNADMDPWSVAFPRPRDEADLAA